MEKVMKVNGNDVKVFDIDYSSMRDFANDIVMHTSIIDEKRAIRLDHPDADAIVLYLFMESFSDMDMAKYKEMSFEDGVAAFMNDMMAEGIYSVWDLDREHRK